MKGIKQFTSRMLAVMLAGTLAVGSVSVSAFGAEDAGSTVAAAEEFSLEEATETENSMAGETTSEVADGEVMTESSSAEVVDGEGVTELPDAAFADTSQIAAEEEVVTSYTVTLDANGGYFANEMDDVLNETLEKTEVLNKIIHVGETVSTVPLNDQEGTTATFLGWSLERDGEILPQEQEEYAPVGDCVLYAVWKYDDAADTSVAIGEEVPEEVLNDPIETEEPEAGGFEGEAAQENDSEDALIDETAAEETAEEAPATYAVTLDANGGYFVNEWDDVLGEYVEHAEVVNKLIPVGGTVSTYPVNEQADAIVTFLGWSLEPDGELIWQEYGEVNEQGQEGYIPVENCFLYAKWESSESVNESNKGTDESKMDSSIENSLIQNAKEEEYEKSEVSIVIEEQIENVDNRKSEYDNVLDQQKQLSETVQHINDGDKAQDSDIYTTTREIDDKLGKNNEGIKKEDKNLINEPETTEAVTSNAKNVGEYQKAIFNGHTYQRFDTSLSWADSKLYCESIGGHLVTITSSEEEAFVEGLCPANGINCWLGGTDEGTEGNWRWVTGEKWSYTNWESGQPDNCQSGTHAEENYLQLSTDYSQKWNDACNIQDRQGAVIFICEWDCLKSDVATIIINDIQGVAGKQFTLSAIINSSSIAPTASNTSWTLERKEISSGNNNSQATLRPLEQIKWGSPSIFNNENGDYTLSVPVNVSLPGIFEFSISFNGEKSKKEIIVVPKRITNLKGTATEKKIAKMNWDSAEGNEYLTGYQLQYADTKSFENPFFPQYKKTYDINDNPLPHATIDCSNINKTRVFLRVAGVITFNNIDYYGEYSDPVEIVLAYTAERDGWCIPNRKEAFGDITYSHTAEKLWKHYGMQFAFYNYGQRLIATEYNSVNSNFGGNCFGTAMLSAANYEGVVNLSSLFNNEGFGLSDYGYSVKKKIGSDYTEDIYSLDGNDDAVSLIERAFFSQYSSEYEETKLDWTNKQIIDYLCMSENPQPIFVSFGAPQETGDGYNLFFHAIVIDPSKKPEYLGDGKYVLHIYDPNVPIDKDRLSNPHPDYSRKSYLYLTDGGRASKDRFQYTILRNDKILGSWSDYNINPVIRTYSPINFSFAKDMGAIFNLSTPLVFRNIFDSMLFGSNVKDIEVKNDNDTVLKISDGSIITAQNNVNIIPEFASGDINNYIYSLRLDNLSYNTSSAKVMLKGKDEKGIFFVNNEGNCMVAFDEENDVVTVNALSDAEVDILTVSPESEKDSIRIKAKIPSNQALIVTRNNNNILLNSSIELDCITSVLHPDNTETRKNEIIILPKTTISVNYKSGTETASLHHFIIHKTNKEPSCTENGSQELVCDWCGIKKTETITKTGHDWDENLALDIAPTEMEQGLASIHCKKCGAMQEGSEIFVPALYKTEKVIDSGSCGDNVTWTLYENGVIDIDGSNDMNNYSGFHDSLPPWYKHKDIISKVIIEDGITSIGDNSL